MSCLILKNDMLKGRRDSPVHLSQDEHMQRLDCIKSLCRSKTMKEELKKVSKVISTVLLPNYAFSCAFLPALCKTQTQPRVVCEVQLMM